VSPIWLEPDWPVPPGVRALTTTRAGGVSTGPYASLNLAGHVGDDPAAVAANRARLARAAGLPAEPAWLQQVHGCGVCHLGADIAARGRSADATVADRPNSVCAVLTADCLPVLLSAEDGGVVAAVHAGWRGLLAGVIEATITRMGRPADPLLAWLGPAIGPAAFEVGPEVRDAYCRRAPAAEAAFRAHPNGRWLADLYALARQRLADAGIERIWGGGHCTMTESERFFSYRRDGVTGRMATLIWIAPKN